MVIHSFPIKTVTSCPDKVGVSLIIFLIPDESEQAILLCYLMINKIMLVSFVSIVNFQW